jgi:putative transcriptional regulator
MKKKDTATNLVTKTFADIVQPLPPVRQMTEEEVMAAALSDPDNQPWTEERMAGVKILSRLRSIRRALDLTQEEFSERYQIPLGTLRDWEQGRSEPDAPARAYIKAIRGDPEGVAKALQWCPRAAAE